MNFGNKVIEMLQMPKVRIGSAIPVSKMPDELAIYQINTESKYYNEYEQTSLETATDVFFTQAELAEQAGLELRDFSENISYQGYYGSDRQSREPGKGFVFIKLDVIMHEITSHFADEKAKPLEIDIGNADVASTCFHRVSWQWSNLNLNSSVTESIIKLTRKKPSKGPSPKKQKDSMMYNLKKDYINEALLSVADTIGIKSCKVSVKSKVEVEAAKKLLKLLAVDMTDANEFLHQHSEVYADHYEIEIEGSTLEKDIQVWWNE